MPSRSLDEPEPLSQQRSLHARMIAARVSRNPAREAIRALENTGLVEVRPRQGAYVSSFDLDDVHK